MFLKGPTMGPPKTVCFVALLWLAVSLPLSGQTPEDADFLIRGAEIHTQTGQDYARGDLLVRSGKIAAIGENLPAPEGIRIIDGQGKTVIPGLIDSRCAYLFSPLSKPVSRVDGDVLDLLDPFRTDEMTWALAQGVTSAALVPVGSTGLCGRISVVKFLAGVPLTKMVLKKDVAVKAALPADSYGKVFSRLSVVSGVERQLKAALAYRETWETYEESLEEYLNSLESAEEENSSEKEPQEKPEGEEPEDEPPPPEEVEKKESALSKEPEKKAPEQKTKEGQGKKEKKEAEKPKKPKRPARVPANEILLKALDGEMALYFEVHRAADILNVLALRERYPVNLILVGGEEASLVGEAVEQAGVSLVLGWLAPDRLSNTSGFAAAPTDNLLALENRGLRLALSGSGGVSLESRFLGFNAALAAGAGLDPARALELVTIEAARILGIDDRVGSLEVGKDADLVILSGAPLDSDARVEKVFINGKTVYERKG